MCRGRRLARVLHTRWADAQRAAGKKAWISPAIYSIDAYQLRLWERAVSFTDGRQLLSDGAARHLFVGIVNERVPAYIDGFAPTTGEALYRSYRLATEWCIDADELGRSAQTIEQSLFAEVVHRYRERLRSGRWLDPAGLPAALIGASLSDNDLPHAGIQLAGFLSLTPLQDRLFASWRDRGCRVERLRSATDAKAPINVRAVADEQDEWLQAGAWARQNLTDDPRARVAVVVPGLSTVAQTAPTLIADALTPGWQLDDSAAAIHTSLGQSLLSYPLIAAWFRPFAGLGQAYRFDALSELLRDATLLPAAAWADCAQLERSLRAEAERRWRLTELRGRLDGESNGFRALDVLCELDAEFADARDENSLRHWVSRLASMAERIVALGDGANDSIRFQLTNAWRQSLNALADLDVVEPRVTGYQAIALWRRLLAATVFQPEDVGTRLDVLGPLEIVGDHYDAVWIARLDDEQWPPTAQADPFISRQLQTSRQMPGTDRARDGAFAAHLLDNIVASSASVVMSFATRRGDVVARLAPSVVRRFGNASDLPAEPMRRFVSDGKPDCESVSESVVPLHADEVLRGGVGLLATALEAPLLAFAAYRLNAEPLPPAVRGIGALIRGNILHQAAELAVRSRPNEDIPAAVETALSRYRRHDDSLLHRLLDAEQQRTVVVLELLADFDRKRGDHDVLGLEAPVELRLGALTLPLRIDRLDSVAGRAVLIDYKTGLRIDGGVDAHTGLPRQLQLAAYVLALGQQRSDLAFGASALMRLHPRGVIAEGVAFTSDSLPFSRRVQEDETVLDRWSMALSEVATTISSGSVTRSPSVTDDPQWWRWQSLDGASQ
ncbi:MAG: PD-(D/E)XK nuclease family protein [Pseudomonadota bacterium]